MAVLLLWIFYVFVLSCVCYVFVRVCLYVIWGHLLGKGWPLASRLWCLLWVCHFPIGILGQVWYLIVSIPDLCTLTYFVYCGYLAQTFNGTVEPNRPNTREGICFLWKSTSFFKTHYIVNHWWSMLHCTIIYSIL